MIDTQAIRSKILDLAMRGKLTEQLPEDGTAEELYRQIQAEKHALIKAGKIKKEKPLLEIVADVVPFEIPADWKWVRIGSILTLQPGKNIPASDIENVPDDSHLFPCYGGNGQRGFVEQANTDGFHAIIGRQGALCGNINFAEGPFYATEHAVVVFGYAGINMKWAGITLRYLNLNQYATSVAQPGLAVGKIDNVLMPLPPLAEQHRIVARIEQAFSALDSIDALQAKYADNLAVLKSKLIDAAIQGKLTEQLPEDGTAEDLYRHLREKKRDIEDSGILKGRKKKAILPVDDVDFPFPIPATWKWIRLDSVAEIYGRIGFRGYTRSDIVKQGEGAISLSPSNITIDGKCVYDKCTYITWEKYEESPEIIVAEEDLIIVKTGSSYGKCGVVKELPEKATINPQLALLKYILCDRYYLHTVLNSTMARKQYEDFVVGAATPTFSQEDLANFILPLPPLAEQKRIVGRLTEVLTVCDELKADSKRLES